MQTIVEGTLQFDFSESVQAIKYDESNWKNTRFGIYPAMDILAREQDQQWWIEIKDCVGAEERNRPRLSAQEPKALVKTRQWIEAEGFKPQVRAIRNKPFIIHELVEKLRSTLIGCDLAGVHGFSNQQAGEQVGVHRLIDGDQPLIVVLYLTWEGNDFRRLARGLQTKLDKALQPYGWRGFIVNDPSRLRQTGIGCVVSRV